MAILRIREVEFGVRLLNDNRVLSDTEQSNSLEQITVQRRKGHKLLKTRPDRLRGTRDSLFRFNC